MYLLDEWDIELDFVVEIGTMTKWKKSRMDEQAAALLCRRLFFIRGSQATDDTNNTQSKHV